MSAHPLKEILLQYFLPFGHVSQLPHVAARGKRLREAVGSARSESGRSSWSFGARTFTPVLHQQDETIAPSPRVAPPDAGFAPAAERRPSEPLPHGRSDAVKQPEFSELCCGQHGWDRTAHLG